MLGACMCSALCPKLKSSASLETAVYESCKRRLHGLHRNECEPQEAFSKEVSSNKRNRRLNPRARRDTTHHTVTQAQDTMDRAHATNVSHHDIDDPRTESTQHTDSIFAIPGTEARSPSPFHLTDAFLRSFLPVEAEITRETNLGGADGSSHHAKRSTREDALAATTSTRKRTALTRHPPLHRHPTVAARGSVSAAAPTSTSATAASSRRSCRLLPHITCLRSSPLRSLRRGPSGS